MRCGGERPEFRPKTSQAANAYPAAKLDAARAAKHTSLAAQCCTREVWAQYKDKLSTGPARPAQIPLFLRLGLRRALLMPQNNPGSLQIAAVRAD